MEVNELQAGLLDAVKAIVTVLAEHLYVVQKLICVEHVLQIRSVEMVVACLL